MQRIFILGMTAALWGQAPTPPVRILRGELIEWDVRGLAGEMAVRQADHLVERCRVLPDTYMARELIRVSPMGVRAGDTVEVIGDFREGPSRCIALTIYIKMPAEIKRATGDSPLRSSYTRYLNERSWMQSLLSYAGVVTEITDKKIVLRTRQAGLRTLVVRDDTMFSDTGRLVEPSDLPVYTRVYVKANRRYDGSLEATSVVWGDILMPQREWTPSKPASPPKAELPPSPPSP